MAEPLIALDELPETRVIIAGWRRQWSDGGNISSGMPRWLIDKLSARRIGQMTDEISRMCFPFQVAGTHGPVPASRRVQRGLAQPSHAMGQRILGRRQRAGDIPGHRAVVSD